MATGSELALERTARCLLPEQELVNITMTPRPSACQLFASNNQQA